jgi:hypothetical protein
VSSALVSGNVTVGYSYEYTGCFVDGPGTSEDIAYLCDLDISLCSDETILKVSTSDKYKSLPAYAHRMDGLASCEGRTFKTDGFAGNKWKPDFCTSCVEDGCDNLGRHISNFGLGFASDFLDSRSTTYSPVAHAQAHQHSLDTCAIWCQERGFKYMGLSGTSMCYCDNTYVSNNAVGGARRTSTEPQYCGDAGERCGVGILNACNWTVAVYHIQHQSMDMTRPVPDYARACTDSAAVNYDSAAAKDDGSCMYDCDLLSDNATCFIYDSTADLWQVSGQDPWEITRHEHDMSPPLWHQDWQKSPGSPDLDASAMVRPATMVVQGLPSKMEESVNQSKQSKLTSYTNLESGSAKITTIADTIHTTYCNGQLLGTGKNFPAFYDRLKPQQP